MATEEKKHVCESCKQMFPCTRLKQRCDCVQSLHRLAYDHYTQTHLFYFCDEICEERWLGWSGDSDSEDDEHSFDDVTELENVIVDLRQLKTNLRKDSLQK